MRILALAVLALCASCARPEPAPPQDSDAQRCTTATDCTAILPHLCRICANGVSECAHWTCASGSCAVALCGELQSYPR